MNSSEIINIISNDTSWCHKKENIVDTIMSDLVQIIRMEDFMDFVTNNRKDYSDDMVTKYNENITFFKIDLIKNII